MIERAIQVYHEQLDQGNAEETAERLQALMKQRHLTFGERPLCTVLRPYFLTSTAYSAMQQVCRTLLGAFDRLFQAMLEQPALLEEVGLSDFETQAFRIDPGYRTPAPTGRLDSFLIREPGRAPAIQFVEYNAETPAGAGYEAILTDCFLQLPIMKRFLQHYHAHTFPLRRPVLETLLAMHREANGPVPPTIAIVDWEEVPTRNEFEIFKNYFRQQGYDALITSPERLTYDGTTLRAGDRAVHILYKRVLGSELLQRHGLNHPILQALRDGRVTMVNPFRCKPLHKKMSFALLSDDRYHSLYTSEQCRAIAHHVPWTRKLADRTTTVNGRRVDLLRYVEDHQQELVLKPNDEYGGKGVILGWKVTSETWRRAMEEGLETPTIVQRRVKIARESFPAMMDGKLDISDRMVDLDPFLYEGNSVQGLLVRLSTSSLLNVTAGGGSVTPAIILEPRD